MSDDICPARKAEVLAMLRDRLRPPAPAVAAPCPDCRGTGEYRGLLTIETCRTCDGKKIVNA